MTAIGSAAMIDLVSDFYGAAMDGRFWPTALMKLREAFDGTACALGWHDYGSGGGALDQAVGIDVESVRSYREYYGRLNLWLQREDAFRAPQVAWTGAQLVGEDEALASEYYHHWLEPQGLAHQLFGVLERQANRVLYLLIARPATAAPFGDAEAALLRRLLPYLQRGLRAGQMLRRTQHVRQAALDALDVMPIGVILLTAGGVVLAANRVAREVMAARDVLAVGRSGLEVTRSGRRVLFRDLIADAHGRADHNLPPELPAFAVARPGSQRPLSLLLWPTREPSTGQEEPAAVVFLGDPDRANEINEARLRHLYGLTAAEARVAALLAQGHRLDEIAELLGVAYETTRKHLKQIFGKTNIARQAELVRMVNTGPGALTV
jgi:DNA-binding CsgD family transcriptional regulator/PAS domain-containing protein